MAEEMEPQPDEEAARRTASKVVERSRNNAAPEDEGVVEFRSGLKLRVREVPPLILRQPLKDLPEPEPPTVHIESKGRSEPNPNDPEYLEAHAKWQLTVGWSVMDTMLLLGTTEPSEEGEPRPMILERPDSIFPPEADGWVKWLEAAGVTVDLSTPNTRYLCWLRYYAVSNTEDFERLTAAIAGKSGVKEEDVENASKAFPGDAARGANSGSDSQPNRADRRALSRSRPRSDSRN